MASASDQAAKKQPEGVVTALVPPAAPGAYPTVDIKTEEVVDDSVVDMLHDGKNVWVRREAVLEILGG